MMMNTSHSPSKATGHPTSKGRVVSSAGDPADEIRATIASLTARAQQLMRNDTDQRIVSQGRSLYELSKKAAEDTRQQVRRATTGEAYPASQASVELFMAKHLGFDVQEQQRLLQQLQANNAKLASELASVHPGTGLTDRNRAAITAVPGGDVEALVARMKGEILARNEHEVHLRVKEQLQRLEDAVTKAGWIAYSVGVSDDMEMLSLRSSAGGAVQPPLPSRLILANTPTSAPRSSMTLVNVLNSGSPIADEMNRKVAAFAPIVEHQPPASWCAYFTAYVTEQSHFIEGDAMAALWDSIHQMLDPVQRQGSSATTLSYAAASRQIIERKALSHLLIHTMRLDPSRFDEVANIHTSRVLDLIGRTTSTTNPWVHLFQAMRCGRYDAAREVAKRLGNTVLETVLEKCAAATPEERSRLMPMVDLRDLYAEPHTHEDVHRRAVLFLLLAGSTGESEDAALRTLQDLCNQVATSLEDVLWLRLCCVRSVDATKTSGRVQSLSFMHKIILDDLPDLVATAHGNILRLASLLFHALLPSSALRLLLENDSTFVDGFHLALCFNQCNLLDSAPLETPLDLARHIRRYCSLVLLDADRRYAGCASAGASIFNYFHRTGFDESFAEFCVQDLVATRLFGVCGSAGTTPQRALLNAGASPELMKAMSNIAELAVSRGNLPVAVHVLLALADAAMRSGKSSPHTVQQALLRAVQIVSPAIAQSFAVAPHTSYVTQLLTRAGQLRDTLRTVATSVVVDNSSLLPPPRDLSTFEMLCTLADVYIAEANGNLEHALGCFLSLPFVPTTGEDVDRCVREYGLLSNHLVAACGALLPVVLRCSAKLIDLYAQESSQQQVYGSGASHNASSSSLASGGSSSKEVNLRFILKNIVEWMRRASSQSSAGSTTYHTCAKVIQEVENTYLRQMLDYR